MKLYRPPASPPFPPAVPPNLEDPRFERIVHDVSRVGYTVCPGFFDAAATAELARECRGLQDEGAFRRAGVGSGDQWHVREDVRGDRVAWLDEATAGPAQKRLLGELEALRRRLNQELFLGLIDWEGHFAAYPPGAFYHRHLDRFRRTARRAVTVILYLNEDWTPADGGLLRLYLDPVGGADGCGPFEDVVPHGGTLVVFLAGDFYHEVLPARRERLSVTGWFRTRGSDTPRHS